MINRRHLLGAGAGVAATGLLASAAAARNPIVPGWYADPEIHLFGNRYWIYPTLSDDPSAPEPKGLSAAQRAMRAAPDIRPAFLNQTRMDAFSSPDLVHWTRHPSVLDLSRVSWAGYALWAPSVIEMDGRYYLFFGANDIRHDGQTGGIGLAVADAPGGPFRDALGHPLIDVIRNGAQPIDPFVFRDDDGQIYLYYGGWGHCNVVRLSPDLTSLMSFPGGRVYREITPKNYVEGSFMVKRRGIYYFMWSEGGWTGPDYKVAYAMGPSPIGPFRREGVILQQDLRVATGAGHHSVLNIPGTDDWYICYHRHPLGSRKGDERVLAIETLSFAPDGRIRPVVLTTAGVAPRPLAQPKRARA